MSREPILGPPNDDEYQDGDPNFMDSDFDPTSNDFGGVTGAGLNTDDDRALRPNLSDTTPAVRCRQRAHDLACASGAMCHYPHTRTK